MLACLFSICATSPPPPPPITASHASPIQLISRIASSGLAADAISHQARWDKPLGGALLRTASLLLLRPASTAIREVKRVDMVPDEQELRLAHGPLATLTANVTHLHIGGLNTLSSFLDLTADGPEHVVASSAFGRLETRASLNARLLGPLGAGELAQPLVLSAVMEGVAVSLRFRLVLKEGVLAAVVASKGSLAALDRADFDIALANVTVSLNGAILVSVTTDDPAACREDASGGEHSRAAEEEPPLIWRLFSRALSSSLRSMVEKEAAAAIRHSIETVLDEFTATAGSVRVPRGNAAPRGRASASGSASGSAASEVALGDAHAVADLQERAMEGADLQ